MALVYIEYGKEGEQLCGNTHDPAVGIGSSVTVGFGGYCEYYKVTKILEPATELDAALVEAEYEGMDLVDQF